MPRHRAASASPPLRATLGTFELAAEDMDTLAVTLI